MTRGQTAKVGSTRIAPNGYHYTRTADGWRLTHHILAEKHVLHRPILKDERVTFRDKDRTNLKPENLVVSKKQGSTIDKRRATILARIEDLKAKLLELDAEESTA